MSLFDLVAGIGQGRKAKELQQKEEVFRREAIQLKILADAAQDPDKTGDERQHIYDIMGEIAFGGKGKNGKGGGNNPLQNILGNLDARMITGTQTREGVRPGGPAPEGEGRPTVQPDGQMGADMQDFFKQEGLPPQPTIITEPVYTRRGSMTGHDIALLNREKEARAVGGIKDEYDAKNDERTRLRAIEVANVRNQGAIERLKTRFEQQKTLLDDKQKFELTKKVEILKNAYLGTRTDDPVEAERMARAQVVEEAESLVAARREQAALAAARAKDIPKAADDRHARVMQGWKRIEQGEEILDQGWARISATYDTLDSRTQKQVDDLALKAASEESQAAYFELKKDAESATSHRQLAASYRKQAEEIAARPSRKPTVPTRPSNGASPPTRKPPQVKPAEQIIKMSDVRAKAEATGKTITQLLNDIDAVSRKRGVPYTIDSDH